MKAIIVGAGPAGLATARWLRRAGWECLLIEHRPPAVPISLSEGAARGALPGGYAIDFFGPGHHTVERMDLDEQLHERDLVLQGVQLRAPGGHPTSRLDLAPFVARSTAGGSHCYVVTWRRFCTTPSTRGWRFDKG